MKLKQGSGKDGQGMALKAKGLKGSGEVGGGKGRCVGSIWVTLGSL